MDYYIAPASTINSRFFQRLYVIRYDRPVREFQAPEHLLRSWVLKSLLPFWGLKTAIIIVGPLEEARHRLCHRLPEQVGALVLVALSEGVVFDSLGEYRRGRNRGARRP